MSQPPVTIPGSPVVPNMVSPDHVIQFSCHKGIGCWNACCSNIDISLTPYDIIRLKKRLGITSTEFLKEYTVPYEMEKDGIAGFKFRSVDNGTAFDIAWKGEAFTDSLQHALDYARMLVGP